LIRKIFTTRLLSTIVILLIISAGFFLLSNTSAMPRKISYSDDALWDMRDFDFEQYNATLSGYAEFIPNVLFSPNEFEAWANDAIVGDARYFSHATSRQTFLTSDDGWYTFTRTAARYAHRVYVNGQLVTSVGLPGDSAETNVQGYGRITITAQAENGVIEIVQQVSNFVGTRGSHHHTWSMGVGDSLINEARVADSQNAMIMGAFLIMSVLSLLLHFLLIKSRGMLFSSLFCMIWYMRLGAAGSRTLAPFANRLGGSILFRMEYVTIPLAFITALATVNELFPNVLNKIFLRAIYVFCATLALLYMFAGTQTVAQINSFMYPAYGAVFAFIIICFTIKVRKISLGQRLFMAGVIIAVIFVAVYTLQLALPDIFPAFTFDPTGVPMLIFVFLMAMAVFVATMSEAEQMKKRAYTDPLTDMFNRRYFMDNSELALQESIKSNHDFSIVMMDIDYFKKINDTYGHSVGDDVLKIFAMRIRHVLRDGEIAARYGGEEFIVALPKTSKEDALATANRIQDNIRKLPFIMDGLSIPVTASIGVASKSEVSKTMQSIIDAADAAVYEAKNAGRNMVILKEN